MITKEDYEKQINDISSAIRDLISDTNDARVKILDRITNLEDDLKKTDADVHITELLENAKELINEAYSSSSNTYIYEVIRNLNDSKKEFWWYET